MLYRYPLESDNRSTGTSLRSRSPSSGTRNCAMINSWRAFDVVLDARALKVTRVLACAGFTLSLVCFSSLGKQKQAAAPPSEPGPFLGQYCYWQIP